jgi:hypothetical protein
MRAHTLRDRPANRVDYRFAGACEADAGWRVRWLNAPKGSVVSLPHPARRCPCQIGVAEQLKMRRDRLPFLEDRVSFERKKPLVV